MATTTQTVAETKEEAPEVQTHDGPLLDLSDAAVKKMIKEAKKRGYVTVDELNSVLPSEEVTSEQIEDTMAMLSDMGINVVESDEPDEAEAEAAEDEPEEESEGRELMPSTGTAVAKKGKGREPTDRTDDPVRMYLREMGSVELLSREGEIAIAKRIEAGREAMIAGLCENPLTFQAIIIWRDELNAGNVLLRDIIDLEATYAGPDAKAPTVTPPPGAPAENGDATKAASPAPAAPARPPRPPRLRATARRRRLPPISMPTRTTITRTTSRLPPWRRRSSRRFSRPSTASPRTTRSSAGCRTPSSAAARRRAR